MIKKIREDHKLTQTELAEMIYTTQVTISRIESGKHNINVKQLLFLLRAGLIDARELVHLVEHYGDK